MLSIEQAPDHVIAFRLKGLVEKSDIEKLAAVIGEKLKVASS